jgi:hypothetical protein
MSYKLNYTHKEKEYADTKQNDSFLEALAEGEFHEMKKFPN